LILNSQSPGEIKSREVELGSSQRVGQSFAGPGEITRREVELLDLQESPGEIKGRKMELGFHRKLDNPLLRVFLNNTLRASLSGTSVPPNSARFIYATEGALFVSAQLSSDAVSALRKVLALI